MPTHKLENNGLQDAQKTISVLKNTLRPLLPPLDWQPHK
jgi:hypothetical protein